MTRCRRSFGCGSLTGRRAPAGSPRAAAVQRRRDARTMSMPSRTLADRQTKPLTRLLLGVLTWIIVLIFFFPVFWMALTGLKTEPDANTYPPHFIFKPTLAEYTSDWKGAGGYLGLSTYMEHSAVTTVLATLAVLLLALPAAYALSIRPILKWRDVLFFFISTKMLPVVGAIIPLYVIAKHLGWIDHLQVLDRKST